MADRRVERSRRMLRDALVALILERGWDDVSVKDVCDRADVGRSTFYSHFGDKEELLVSGFDDLLAHLRGAHDPGALLPFVRPLIEHAIDNVRLFRAVIGKRSGRVVERRFRELVLVLVGEALAPRDEPTVRFVAGGVLELLSAAIDARSLAVEPLNGRIQALTARCAGPGAVP